jgi:CRP-like cAMP-binding protein
MRKIVSNAGVALYRIEPQQNLPLRTKTSEYLYIILSGYLEVRLNSSLLKNSESFLLAFRGPGQVVGEMSAVAHEQGVAFISASEPCELIRIPSEALIRVADQYGRIYRNLCMLLVQKTRQERHRIEVSLMSERMAQVAQALINFLDERGADKEADGTRVIHGRLRHTDIANYIGCHRTTVTRPLGSLKQRGIIGYPDQGRPHEPVRFRIRDRRTLEAIARSKN